MPSQGIGAQVPEHFDRIEFLSPGGLTDSEHDVPRGIRRALGHAFEGGPDVPHDTVEKRQKAMEAIRSILLIGICLAVVGLGGLVVVGGGDGVYEGERRVQVSARKAKVYDWVVQPQNRTEWVSGLLRSSSGPGGYRVGAKVTEVVSTSEGEKKRELEITELEDGKRFGYRTLREGGTFEIVYEVGSHPTGSRSLVSVTYKVTWDKTWQKLLEPVLSSRVQAELNQELERLKEAIESSH